MTADRLNADRRAEAGFSLIETLVSLAIIAGMMGVFMDSIQTNAKIAAQVAQRREAVMLARSLLAQATTRDGGIDMPSRGRSRTLAWTIRRGRVEGGARASGPPLEEVRIEIVDAVSGRHLTGVRTLGLAR